MNLPQHSRGRTLAGRRQIGSARCLTARSSRRRSRPPPSCSCATRPTASRRSCCAATRSSRSRAARGCSPVGASIPRTIRAARCPTTTTRCWPRLATPPRGRRWKRPGSWSTLRRRSLVRALDPRRHRARDASPPGSSSASPPKVGWWSTTARSASTSGSVPPTRSPGASPARSSSSHRRGSRCTRSPTRRAPPTCARAARGRATRRSTSRTSPGSTAASPRSGRATLRTTTSTPRSPVPATGCSCSTPDWRLETRPTGWRGPGRHSTRLGQTLVGARVRPGCAA